ncbi:hypothetical protein CYMTET_49196 [Cymbomonas tetramitiformis]|uniref:Uncharacterized protein n=1 Tax=Cymbomonas tetramitiformis TaxID=36881 RepID=A0AAE0BSC8_9CHLO|nr:hypothetical protein CYMTET_49196 [Cymbomonas tetramitiformis]
MCVFVLITWSIGLQAPATPQAKVRQQPQPSRTLKPHKGGGQAEEWRKEEEGRKMEQKRRGDEGKEGDRPGSAKLPRQEEEGERVEQHTSTKPEPWQESLPSKQPEPCQESLPSTSPKRASRTRQPCLMLTPGRAHPASCTRQEQSPPVVHQAQGQARHTSCAPRSGPEEHTSQERETGHSEGEKGIAPGPGQSSPKPNTQRRERETPARMGRPSRARVPASKAAVAQGEESRQARGCRGARGGGRRAGEQEATMAQGEGGGRRAGEQEAAVT